MSAEVKVFFEEKVGCRPNYLRVLSDAFCSGLTLCIVSFIRHFRSTTSQLVAS